jgi:putative tryptophan/tyrosine transport system substrate-binding protein
MSTRCQSPGRPRPRVTPATCPRAGSSGDPYAVAPRSAAEHGSRVSKGRSRPSSRAMGPDDRALGRRTFIAGLWAAVAWPLAARAQQPRPVIGHLSGLSPQLNRDGLAAFERGLAEMGYVEGHNVASVYRWGDADRLPALAADLVRQQVDLIDVSFGGIAATLLVKGATSTIPIVFTSGSDPVALGLVASLNRPGGNATGVNFLNNELEPKRLGLLRLLIPKAMVIGALLNPDNAQFELQAKSLTAAARSLGVRLHIAKARAESDFDQAFSELAREGAGGVVVGGDAFFGNHSSPLFALAAAHSMPAIYQDRRLAAGGGLMSYGPDFFDVLRQCGIYAGRILKGEKPADMPVMQPTKFELVINLKTAKMLNLTVPDGLILAADEVIE